MDKELYKLADRVMQLMHNIVTRTCEISQEEMDGKKYIAKKSDKMLNIMFSSLADVYNKLEEAIVEEPKLEQEELESRGYVVISPRDANNNVKSLEARYEDIIIDLKTYILNTYTRCKYISSRDLDSSMVRKIGTSTPLDEISIYLHSKFRNLRVLEYNLLQYNFEYMLKRLNIYECGDTLLKFYNGDVLANILESAYSEWGVKQYKRGIEKYSKSTAMSEDTRASIVDMLYVQKAGLEIFAMNNEYNGMLGKNVYGILDVIKETNKVGHLSSMLGMSNDEIKGYAEILGRNCKSTIKEEFSKIEEAIKLINDAENNGMKYKNRKVIYEDRLEAAIRYQDKEQASDLDDEKFQILTVEDILEQYRKEDDLEI